MPTTTIFKYEVKSVKDSAKLHFIQIPFLSLPYTPKPIKTAVDNITKHSYNLPNSNYYIIISKDICIRIGLCLFLYCC